MLAKLRTSVLSLALLGELVRQASTHHHYSVSVVKLSLSLFIIRKAVEPSHSLGCVHVCVWGETVGSCIIQHWQQVTLSPTLKTQI